MRGRGVWGSKTSQVHCGKAVGTSVESCCTLPSNKGTRHYSATGTSFPSSPRYARLIKSQLKLSGVLWHLFRRLLGQGHRMICLKWVSLFISDLICYLLIVVILSFIVIIDITACVFVLLLWGAGGEGGGVFATDGTN